MAITTVEKLASFFPSVQLPEEKPDEIPEAKKKKRRQKNRVMTSPLGNFVFQDSQGSGSRASRVSHLQLDEILDSLTLLDEPDMPPEYTSATSAPVLIPCNGRGRRRNRTIEQSPGPFEDDPGPGASAYSQQSSFSNSFFLSFNEFSESRQMEILDSSI